MFNIRKPIFFIIIMIIIALFCFRTGYALWEHNTEVRFKLTILQSDEYGDCCICGSYTTIQQGIELLRDVQYIKIYNGMQNFEMQVEQRIAEINSLPYGSITFDELKQERDRYVNEDIGTFRNCIATYGSCCINGLVNFYNKASQEQKNEVPDFWVQHRNLWNLSNQLWDKFQDLYDVIDAFWIAGQSKIDW